MTRAMNTPTNPRTDAYVELSIDAWPHHGEKIAMTESEARETVRTVLADAFKIPPNQLAADTRLKGTLNVNWYDLAGPIMTIENFFRTPLQKEAMSDDVCIDMIVEKLMNRA